MVDQLERIGASLEEYLAAEEKTEEQIDAELTEAATEGVKIQLLLDTLADAEDVQVSDDEFGHEIVHRAQRAGMAPQQYYDQLVRSGAAARRLRRRPARQGARRRAWSGSRSRTRPATRSPSTRCAPQNEAEHDHEH